jgi:hypothetical protein
MHFSGLRLFGCSDMHRTSAAEACSFYPSLCGTTERRALPGGAFPGRRDNIIYDMSSDDLREKSPQQNLGAMA